MKSVSAVTVLDPDCDLPMDESTCMKAIRAKPIRSAVLVGLQIQASEKRIRLLALSARITKAQIGAGSLHIALWKAMTAMLSCFTSSYYADLASFL